MPQLLLLDEVAETLRVEVAEVLALVERGELGALRLPAGDLRVPATDLRVFLRARRLDFRSPGEAA
jgi:excisionase family DNA binding protein